MYCILTKSDSSWKLPVTWTGNSGSKVAKKLFERDELYYQKNIVQLWTSEELFNKVGVVHFEEPHIPTGKKTNGSIEDTLDGFVVTRKAPWIDDPDYVAPDTKAIAKAGQIRAIKQEAEKRILAIAPEWKQRNFSFLYKQVMDKTKADAETSTATAATTASEASTVAATAHTDAQAAEATAKETAEAEGATDEQKAAYVTAQEITKTKEAEAVKAEEDSKAAEDTAKAAKAAHDKEKAVMVEQETMWGKVEGIRNKSDELETSIAGMDEEETIHKFDVSLDSNWE